MLKVSNLSKTKRNYQFPANQLKYQDIFNQLTIKLEPRSQKKFKKIKKKLLMPRKKKLMPNYPMRLEMRKIRKLPRSRKTMLTKIKKKLKLKRERRLKQVKTIRDQKKRRKLQFNPSHKTLWDL